MNENNTWKKEDIRFLIINWNEKSTKEIADYLNRSPGAVSRKCGVLRKYGVYLTPKRKMSLKAIVEDLKKELPTDLWSKP